jgi:molybdopterin molybdotransferase
LARKIEDYVTLSQVQDFIKELTYGRGKKETIGTGDAYRRVAASDVVSPLNVPDKARSHMDGYAVLASDLKGASSLSPRILRLKKKGGKSKQAGRLLPRETVWVATGEYLPRGADSVAPVEETKRAGQTVFFMAERRRGDYCYATGSDIRKGYLAIAAGSTIRAQDTGLLILLGVESLEVFARPRIALVATGSELTSAPRADDPSKVRESHTPIFENLIRENGGEPVVIGIVPDEIGKIASALERGLQTSEMAITLGGTSMGERDLVEQAILRLDRRSRIIHGVRMDRGRVAGIAEVNRKPVLMLPGPVQAAMNAFLLLGIPSISWLSGRKQVSGPEVVATLRKDWKARKRFESFTKVVYVRLARRRRGFEAYPILKDTESMSILAESDGFVIVPESTTDLRADSPVRVRLLPGYSYVGPEFFNDG